MTTKKLSILSGERPDAAAAGNLLREKYGFCKPEDADVIVAVGGDGFMLDTLRAHMALGKPFYGVNCGTVGFLMNEYQVDNLDERINAAESTVIHPISMSVETLDGKTEHAMAINEVSLFRQTYQSAKIRIFVNGKVRMKSLSCDGVLLATPAGSTAYNLSAHGPILPIDAQMLALTPISAFRPRRWRGALLPHTAKVRFEAIDADRRPVSAVADNVEVRNAKAVEISEDRKVSMTLLFDAGQSLDERILREQFEF